MPYLKIQTNLPLSKRAVKTVLKTASSLVADELNKPEALVMVALQSDIPISPNIRPAAAESPSEASPTFPA